MDLLRILFIVEHLFENVWSNTRSLVSFTSRCRSVNIITDSLNAHGRMSIPRSTKNNA